MNYVFCYCFFLYLFSFSSILTSEFVEIIFAITSWQRKKTLKRKKIKKKNQEDSTPFLLRSKKIHPEILLGLSCFANLNWIVIVKLFLSFWSNLLHISPNVKRQNCYYLMQTIQKKSRTPLFSKEVHEKVNS